jgi:hypothetical protein
MGAAQAAQASRGFTSSSMPAGNAGARSNQPDDIVLGVLKELAVHADQGAGVGVDEIIFDLNRRGSGFDRNTVLETMQRLGTAGACFTTTDENHFMVSDF